MNEHHLKEDIFRVLRILSSHSYLTQRDLSAYLGFSLGKTNYLIKELTQKGLVKIKNFSKKNHKLNHISYILTPKGLKQKTILTLHFLKRKQQEYEDLRREWGNFRNSIYKQEAVSINGR
jgi:EPS-associated MarR family transcriptional regulator